MYPGLNRAARRLTLACVLGCVFASPAAAGVLYVKADAAGANNGTGWIDAFVDLQAALSAASAGDEIWIAAGTYMPAGPGGNRTATFGLRSGVGLYGGFAGKETERDQRDAAANETILSGDLNGDDRDVRDPLLLRLEQTRAENAYHVVTSSGTDPTAILDGFTITAGYANLASGPNASDIRQWGGGLLNIDGDPTLTHCTFRANYGRYSGGMYSVDGDPMLTHCTFSGNAGTGDVVQRGGTGGMSNDRSNPTLILCTFSGNAAAGDEGFTGVGGGMTNSFGSSPTLTDCVFVGNSSDRAGAGAMVNGRSTGPILTNCTFSANTGDAMLNWTGSFATLIGCTFSGNSYSAITNNGASPTLTNCTFSGNQRGVHNRFGAAPTVTNCVFEQNAGGRGAGMRNDEGTSPTLIDCTFSQNSADFEGGGMYNTDSSHPTLTHCTFEDNEAGGSGGGLFNTKKSRPLLTAYTLVGNSPGAMAAIDGSAPILVNSVIVGNAEGGVFVINASATLINCTVAGNSLGGVSAESGSKLTLTNCVLWGNVDGDDRGESAQVFVGRASTANVDFSVVQGLNTLSGEGNLANDPWFVREMSPGPDGLVGTDDDDHGDLRLRSGSLAIDAGDSTATIPSRSSGGCRGSGGGATALPTLDLDGRARFVDDPATLDTGAGEAPIIDMGAYEFVPLSAAPPELVQIVNGLGSAADTFISPLGEDCALSSFTLEATEPLTLNAAVATYTGPGAVPSATLVDDGGGRYTVMLDPAPEPGQWLKLDLDVTGAGGGTAVFTVWVAHQPLDVTQDGQTNIQDATAFGDTFRGDKERSLIDINCDGQVNVQDATAFGGQWAQWSNSALPAKP